MREDVEDQVEHVTHDAVAKVLLVPGRYRRFSVPRTAARREYGVNGELLDKLLDLGMPSHGTGADITFDSLDLENIALDLRLPSSQVAAMRLWARSLTGPKVPRLGLCEITLSLNCPEPGHRGNCGFSLSSHLAERMDAPRHPESEQLSFQFFAPAENHDFDADFTPVVSEARSLTFHRIPDELVTDMGFLKETGLADCRSASRRLLDVAEDAGYAARPAAGFFLGAPFPCTHAWFEVRVGERWQAADPFFLDTLHHWGILSPEDWPLTRSPKRIVWRIESEHELSMPLIRHGKRPMAAAVAARWR
ncbi:transglutaminase domain-containing protein [Streptomyces sp. NPDC014734]|uniref:transglutaminase domain-containing protein n=1 Tax=Streptomyces sp. NPDC014734 TaxID=3364886 RepID=UPI0036FAB19C